MSTPARTQEHRQLWGEIPGQDGFDAAEAEECSQERHRKQKTELHVGNCLEGGGE
ncbi:MAG: hypothetical protein NPIRA03_17220 [Nitrospirales bacterium]|nr:MAG: hypothetical protein NPIRA03_17220 [Nitrospirales bacterium]